MKCLSLFFVIVLFTQSSVAQFSRGEALIGGNFQITNNFNSPIFSGPNYYFVEGDKTFSIAVTPQAIYFFRNNDAIGLQTGFHYHDSKQGPMSSEGRGYDIGVFFKHYKFFYKGLALAYLVGANYAMTTEKGNGSKYKSSLASIQLSPYLVYRFTDRFSLESALGKAGVGRTTAKDELNNITKKRTEYFAGMFTGFNLSAFYIFGNKKANQ